MLTACETIYQENLINFLTNNLSIMKNLDKLRINSGNIMKNEELMTLRGGYDGDWWWCTVTCPGDGFSGWCCGPYWTYAYNTCNNTWGSAGCFCTFYA